MARSNIPAGYCDSCGHLLVVGMKFCGECGNPVNANTRVISPEYMATISAHHVPISESFTPNTPGEKIYPKDKYIPQPKKQESHGTVEYYYVKSSTHYPNFSVTVTVYDKPSAITVGVIKYKLGSRSSAYTERGTIEKGKYLLQLHITPNENFEISFQNKNKPQYTQTNVYRVRGKELFLDENSSDIAIIHVPLKLIRIG